MLTRLKNWIKENIIFSFKIQEANIFAIFLSLVLITVVDKIFIGYLFLILLDTIIDDKKSNQRFILILKIICFFTTVASIIYIL